MKSLVSLLLFTNVDAGCDVLSEWFHDGKCYHLSSEKKGWEAAKLLCEDLGYQLAVPLNSEIEDLYRDKLSSSGYERFWTGIHKVDKEDETPFVDLDGKAVTFFNWYGNQPDNHKGKEQCVEISNAAGLFKGWNLEYVPGWNDEKCGTKLHPLCVKSCTGEGCCEDCDNECPEEGWTSDGNGNCYKVSSDHKSWGKAQCECAKVGAHLAHLTDHSYEHLLRSTQNLWIGYHLDHNTSTWIDTDGNDATYNNWVMTLPDNFEGNREWCAELHEFSKWGVVENAVYVPGWNDASCHPSVKSKYICQRAVGAVTDAKECIVEPLWKSSSSEILYPTILSVMIVFVTL